MYKNLIDHRVKKFSRSPTLNQNIGATLLVGFFALYFVVVIGTLGLFLPDILQSAIGEEGQIGPIFSKVIIYFMITDLLIRYFFQKLPGMDVKHYLLLPVKKKKLVRFLLNVSVFNIFNFFGLLLIIPFYLRIIRTENGLWHSFAWLMGMLSILAINHFTAILIKRWGALNIRPVLVAAALIAILVSLEYLGWVSILSISSFIFTPLLHSSMGFILLILAAIGLYAINYKHMLRFLYEDLGEMKTTAGKGINRLVFLEKRGVVGSLIQNEIRLMLRNKRPKNLLWVVLFLPVYLAFITYSSPYLLENPLFSLSVVIFATGIFTIQYGQFLTSWESSFFDGLMTQRLSTVQYYQSKWYLLVGACVILYLFMLPLSFFVENFFWFLTVSLLINLGFTNYVILHLGAYNRKGIDLSKSNVMNYEGTSIVHFLIVIPVLLVPLLIYLPFWLLDFSNWGLVALGLLSLFSLSLNKYWFKSIISLHKGRKYKKLSSFRKK